MGLQTVRSACLSSDLLHLLHIPVYSGCIIWALYNFNKTEYASFMVPHCYCLSFRIACSLALFLKKQDGSLEIFCMLRKGMLKRPCCGYRSAKGHTHLFFFVAKTLVLKFQFCSGDFFIVLIQGLLEMFLDSEEK